MFCKNCGNEIKENQKFCPKCGTAVLTETQSTPIQDMSFQGLPTQSVPVQNVPTQNLPSQQTANLNQQHEQPTKVLENKKEKPKMTNGKKAAIICISVFAAIAVIFASVVAAYFTSPAYKVYKNLKNGECSTAVQEYNSSVEVSFIQKFFIKIALNGYGETVLSEYKDGDLTFEEALLILEAMKDMDIENIENKINEIKELNKSETTDSVDDNETDKSDISKPENTEVNTEKPTEKSDFNFKAGFIYLHDGHSTYDLNFMQAAKAACDKYGVTYIEKTNVSETSDCKTATEELVAQGCKIIFANSFGHEMFLLEVAKAHPDVQFCHASGEMANTSGVSNFHNAYARSFEGRYLCGIAAGMKLNEMIDSGEIKASNVKLGYVAAFDFAEVISDYTAFYLGAKSVCPTVTMDVQFTTSWYNEQSEKEAANMLIKRGCKVISQHADSLGAPMACEKAGVPNISYNGSTQSACPNTFIISSSINWQPYFEYIIKCVGGNKNIDTDWCGGIAQGSVVLSSVNGKVAAKGTEEAIKKAKSGLADGSIKVFDTGYFTVGGKKLTTYIADVKFDPSNNPDTEIVKDGYVHECEYRSAPYFDIHIDGINLLNKGY